MSSGQKPRTREHFPKMKVRGARRRQPAAPERHPSLAELLQDGFAAFSRVANELGRLIATTIGHLFAPAASARALAAEEARNREYLQSERYQLDLIEQQHLGDPIAHLNAIAEFFAARAHRELDELQDRLLGTTTVYVDIVPNVSDFVRAVQAEQFRHDSGPRRGARPTHVITDEARGMTPPPIKNR